jgi:hypothetical protein
MRRTRSWTSLRRFSSASSLSPSTSSRRVARRSNHAAVSPGAGPSDSAPLSSPDYLRAFEPQQLDALAYLLLRLHGYGLAIALIFFGYFVALIGYLIYRSGHLPRTIALRRFWRRHSLRACCPGFCCPLPRGIRTGPVAHSEGGQCPEVGRKSIGVRDTVTAQRSTIAARVELPRQLEATGGILDSGESRPFFVPSSSNGVEKNHSFGGCALLTPAAMLLP